MKKQLSQYIDHTLLKQDSTKEQILNLCQEAIENEFFSVCVNPTWISTCKEKLAGTNVEICTVIGFPLGANTTATKVFETKNALEEGATEIDMVINIAMAKMGEYDKITNEINQIKAVCPNNVLKVIIETCLLTEDEIKNVTLAVNDSTADFIKTSTGFSTSGATVAAVEAINSKRSETLRLKVSGGVKTNADLLMYLEMGADRIGTSSGIALIANKETTTSY
ncbi:MAG: deoxyribose-phosphate aldolase [Mycoplasmatales bacterium]